MKCLMMKNTITEMKTLMTGDNSQLDATKEKPSELEPKMQQ